MPRRARRAPGALRRSDSPDDPGGIRHERIVFGYLEERGIASRGLDLVIAERVVPCVSEAVFREYREVLSRPILRPHAVRASGVLALLARVAVQVKPTELVTACTDPDDNCFLECAVSAAADYLVTGNTRHFPRNTGAHKSLLAGSYWNW